MSRGTVASEMIGVLFILVLRHCLCNFTKNSNNMRQNHIPSFFEYINIVCCATKSLAIKLRSSFNDSFRLLPRTHSREHHTPQTSTEVSHKISHLDAKLRHNVGFFFLECFLCDIICFSMMAWFFNLNMMTAAQLKQRWQILESEMLISYIRVQTDRTCRVLRLSGWSGISTGDVPPGSHYGASDKYSLMTCCWWYTAKALHSTCLHS